MKSPKTRCLKFPGNKLPRSDSRHVNSKTDVHSYYSFDSSEKFTAFIYFNFGVLLQEN